jgi:hypothetical protein
MAVFALIEPLAGVGRHCFRLGVSAFRAGQDTFKNKPAHAIFLLWMNAMPFAILLRHSVYFHGDMHEFFMDAQLTPEIIGRGVDVGH